MPHTGTSYSAGYLKSCTLGQLQFIGSIVGINPDEGPKSKDPCNDLMFKILSLQNRELGRSRLVHIRHNDGYSRAIPNDHVRWRDQTVVGAPLHQVHQVPHRDASRFNPEYARGIRDSAIQWIVTNAPSTGFEFGTTGFSSVKKELWVQVIDE